MNCGRYARLSQCCCWGDSVAGMWCIWFCVTGQVAPDMSKDHSAFIFMAQMVQELLDLEDEGTTNLWNISNHWPCDTASHPGTLTQCHVSHPGTLTAPHVSHPSTLTQRHMCHILAHWHSATCVTSWHTDTASHVSHPGTLTQRHMCHILAYWHSATCVTSWHTWILSNSTVKTSYLTVCLMWVWDYLRICRSVNILRVRWLCECLSSGAPTLSMLLELPPSLPGKPLPELPVSSVAKPPHQHLPPSTNKGGKPDLAALFTYCHLS